MVEACRADLCSDQHTSHKIVSLQWTFGREVSAVRARWRVFRQNSLRPGSEDPPLNPPANKVPGQWRPFNNTRPMQAHTIPKPTRGLIPTLYHMLLYITKGYHTLEHHTIPFKIWFTHIYVYLSFSLTYLKRHESNKIDQNLVTKSCCCKSGRYYTLLYLWSTWNASNQNLQSSLEAG